MSDNRRDRSRGDEVLGNSGGDCTVALVIPADQPELVSVDAARLVDLFDGELNALQVLKTVTLLPGAGCSNDVGLFGSGASRQCEKHGRPRGFGQQLPPPHSRSGLHVTELTRPKLYRSLISARSIGETPNLRAAQMRAGGWHPNCLLEGRGRLRRRRSADDWRIGNEGIGDRRDGGCRTGDHCRTPRAGPYDPSIESERGRRRSGVGRPGEVL